MRFLLLLITLLSVLSSLAAETPRIEPVFSRQAQNQEHIKGYATVRYFSNTELQEITNFSAWQAELELAVPFNDTMQFRLLLPVYTSGNGDMSNPWIPNRFRTDVNGWGGTFSYATLQFEHQFRNSYQGGPNLSYYLGAGTRLGSLDTKFGDELNHNGNYVLAGLRADQMLTERRVRLIGNLGGRYYFLTDDLNPTGEEDDFFMLEAKGAVIWEGWHPKLFPALELTYAGIYTDDGYHNLTIAPELLMPLGKRFGLKLGAPIGITDEAADWGVELQLSGQF